MRGHPGYLFALAASVVSALRYDPLEVDFNLNQNQNAVNPVDYSGEWQGHTYTPSPSNWRFPFYSLFLDRFVNGDPSNDDANGTHFEHDVWGNQLRNGGDLAGLADTLDYIHGMGIKGLYIIGTPFLNQPWDSNGYSPLDFSLLDHHFGNITVWRAAIDEIHSRGMYIILDSTMSTMADLVGFEGFNGTSTPFSQSEHNAVWKTDQHYSDFSFQNNYNATCQYPRFWNDSGYPVTKESDANFSKLVGCFNSEFDQYGDTEAFGVFPDWQRQLSKFASVQDRLREWFPPVRQKIESLTCLAIAMLDIDGFRFDKATQVTVDAQAEFGEAVRQCARDLGKENFFMLGEITGGNTFGSIYLGRGRQPDMIPDPSNFTVAVTLTNNSDDKYFLRDPGLNALDAAAFHYSIYRGLLRFLGMDGNITVGWDLPVNFVDAWNNMITTNDFVNAMTGEFDPRHMYGTTNQDLFRWPAIKNGTEKMLLGQFITTLHMPGIPLLLWGEEQAFYVLDNTADDYLFGRQPMSSSLAWENHGCYQLGSSLYYNFPVDAATDGCRDDSVSLDHRDPTHPLRNILKSMYNLRQNYPVLNDGYSLQSLSNQTHFITMPGSNETATEYGMWSVLRDQFLNVQDLSEDGEGGNQSVWLVFQNDNKTITYQFDCTSNETALISPFDANTTVKNLFAPYEEIELKASPMKLGIDYSEEFNGCLDNLELEPWAFKAFVPKSSWIPPLPMLTKFVPGHDARILSTAASTKVDIIDIELQFSEEMDCNHLTQNIVINSTAEDNTAAQLDTTSISCSNITADAPPYSGGIASTWSWKAKLSVPNGIHTITVQNATSSDGERSTEANDRLLLRVGQAENPIVFPRLANYTQDVLLKDASTGSLSVSHKAAGADKWRYSLNWQSSWSDWTDYQGGNSTLAVQPWNGTSRQKWKGDHVILQYWSRMSGSSNYYQHADANWANQPPRRYPHLFAHGPFNEFGFDGGLNDNFEQDTDGIWKFHLMTEWPSKFQVNVWGMNPDGLPDQTFIMGDVDNDTVLDRLPPNTLAAVFVNLTALPPSPYLAYRMELNDANNSFRLVFVGSRLQQILVFALLWVIPVLTGAISIWTYMGAFYGVKFNEIGVSQKKSILAFFSFRRKFQRLSDHDERDDKLRPMMLSTMRSRNSSIISVAQAGKSGHRRTVLIATMEYDIEDWSIKIKIGGLGVMAQLMGKNLEHQDLIWVVPCVGGVEYPQDTPADPMTITILGKPYEIEVQYHKLKNITYVLLDAPVFRQQSKTEPYPPRMDDLDSAIYYSAWNACIAETIKRFPVELYHINDYHGAAAPLYLLPQTIPCCLSLHNAEFQGLWPMRNPKESEEVCKVFNLDPTIVQTYVQFGEVFNLLHAGASYLRVHQKGFGAVGVSNKYGARSYARYPIFWGLKEIGKLPNPDPSDTAPWNREEEENQVIRVDPEFERSRSDLRKQAQEWAGLEVNPQAELFVFVGRWSVQKGVDLIADVFPAVLDKHKAVQLICIGPVIDLYGKFAALKLGEMMKVYPRRVYSKPEFTALPPYIFSGAEFALIPSRDEPFGLVAVEFGRKGALGVGARVGGLGQMPGWWFTVESTTTKHLQHQFKSAIEDALASKTDVRAMMRARSAKQRFPVAKWVEDLDALQSTAIKIHKEEGGSSALDRPRAPSPSPAQRPGIFRPGENSSTGLSRSLSLGVRAGPGHSRIDRPVVPDVVPMPGIDESDDEGSVTSEYLISEEQAEDGIRVEERDQTLRQLEGNSNGLFIPPYPEDSRGRRRSRRLSAAASVERSRSRSPAANEGLLAAPANNNRLRNRSSVLSLNEVIGARKDYSLQKVDPTFNDTTGEYYEKFEKMLRRLDAKSSETELCIEEYLVESEKEWFKKMRDAKLGRSRDPSPSGSTHHLHKTPSQTALPDGGSEDEEDDNLSIGELSVADEFLLGDKYKRPSILKRWLQTRIGDWPVYSLLLGLGQIIAANSYQITLLEGGQAQVDEKLYIIGGIYIATSCLWWIMFRTLKSAYVLSVPFLFYGLAFFLIGLAPFFPVGGGRDWMRNVATGMYTTASASGSIFFALNFGDEGGAPIKSWVLRACIIQGTQQIYITALFYWGSVMATAMQTSTTTKTESHTITSSKTLAAITLPVGGVLWLIGIVLFTSLPPYYRQSPGKIPNFYQTLLRRKIIGWFFVTVILQNYFLSTPYGRNWGYLWSSQYAPHWALGLLVLAFFIGVWAGLLAIFGQLSKSHSWILPIFAIGLGAPRWAQMLWGVSGFGLWIPWMPGGHVAGALAGRALWLWLGVLDSIQGVGFGMMLLSTLTRIHIAVALVAAQILGAGVTLIAKATAPDKNGPGDVFPDFSAGILPAISKPWFWIALVFQLIIPVGFFLVFRKAQLSKP